MERELPYIDIVLSGEPAQVRTVLAEYPADAMVAWPVSARANSPRNDGAELIEPLTVSPARDLFS